MSDEHLTLSANKAVHLAHGDLEVMVYLHQPSPSDDPVVIVDIDSARDIATCHQDLRGQVARVYVNDAPVWSGDWERP